MSWGSSLDLLQSLCSVYLVVAWSLGAWLIIVSCIDTSDVSQVNHNNVSSNAESLRKQLKDLEARKPEVDNKVQAAYRTVETIGQDVSQLEAELSDAEKVAADLERKAREARYEFDKEF